jgi:RNA polymerase sigma-70 factor (ECF subfamily)
MPSVESSTTVTIAPDLVRRLYEQADAARWGLRDDDLRLALERSVRHRFQSASLSAFDVAHYLESLYAGDLALACACSLGREEAWEHFVREFRPVLVRVASRNAPLDAARDVADSIYAELYGLEERDGVRRSIFDYYHGRSSLVSWLRAVVGQRLVDRARERKRLAPLPEAGEPGEPTANVPPPDVDRGRMLPAVRAALKASIAALEPRDRLRLSLYYTQDLKLAAIGRTIGESEATASRKLERTRRGLRAAVERRLRDDHGMTEREVRASFDYARTDPAFDLARDLPPG